MSNQPANTFLDLNSPQLRQKECPVVVAIQGPLDGRRWEIQDELIIGRGEDCQIQIDDRQVSRHHARISQVDGKMILEDLASKNGTFLSGNLISESVPLADADMFQIAIIYKFVFYCSDATMPMEDLIPPLTGGATRLVVDEKSRRVWVQGKELTPPLSAPQFRLLGELVSHAGRVISRNDLVHAIWADEEAEGVSEQALDALIRRLRDRLADIDPGHSYIVTVRGHGLRFCEKE
ncbi:MAG: FHA domain-containing protein [Anaerolineae bacterium]|nr:FHA domain-containing protein [Anaerolineae bacterium]